MAVAAGFGEDGTLGGAGCFEFDGAVVVLGAIVWAVGSCVSGVVAVGFGCGGSVAGISMDGAGGSGVWGFAGAISTFPEKGNWKALQHENATRAAVLENLPQYSVVHFSCHGSANFRTPLNSGLLMAHDETLSLRDLLDLNLQGLRLAILSACETGIPGTDLPDEVVSLPTGLLQAGAAGVVSSLWSVAELSTMVLLSLFYELWRSEHLDPPEALRQAQIWLRDSTGPALAPYLKPARPDLAQKLDQSYGQRPFAHPFYWAAFTYTGV